VSSLITRRAIVRVAEKLSRDESISIPAGIIEAAGDVEHYIEQAARSALARDSEALKKNLRDAQRQGLSLDIAFPGMDHASLPRMVFIKDAESGEEFAIPASQATLDQIDTEISKQRRSVSIQDRVVSGWEATSCRARELGATGEWTGAELEANFPREIES
jgi:hypothetical protein